MLDIATATQPVVIRHSQVLLPLIVVLFLSNIRLSPAQTVLDSLGCTYLEELFDKISDPQLVTDYYFRALNDLRLPGEANRKRLERLSSDISSIISQKELRFFQGLQTATEKVAFFTQFWYVRDLTPATPVHERLIEHYTRLNHARQKFPAPAKPGYDARGDVYIRYGPPDEKVIDAVPRGSAPFETWAYYRFASPATFDFVRKGFAYWLATNIDDGIVFTNKPIAYLNELAERLRQRAGLSLEYNKLWLKVEEYRGMGAGTVSKNFVNIRRELQRSYNEFFVENTTTIANLPQTTSRVLDRWPDLPLDVQIALFRAPGKKHDLVVSYGFQLDDLLPTDADSEIVMYGTTAVRNAERAFLTGKTDTLAFAQHDLADSSQFVACSQFKLPEGGYFVAVDVKAPETQQRGLRDFTVSTGNYASGKLGLSVPILAKQVVPISERRPQPGYFIRGNLAIRPHPFTLLQRRDRVYLYFEIYNLQLDRDGETRFEVQYRVQSTGGKGLLSKLNPLGGKRRAVSVTDLRYGHVPDEQVFLQLGFGDLEEGDYVLHIRVTDLVAGVRKEKRMPLVLK